MFYLDQWANMINSKEDYCYIPNNDIAINAIRIDKTRGLLIYTSLVSEEIIKIM